MKISFLALLASPSASVTRTPTQIISSSCFKGLPILVARGTLEIFGGLEVGIGAMVPLVFLLSISISASGRLLHAGEAKLEFDLRDLQPASVNDHNVSEMVYQIVEDGIKNNDKCYL
jgi:hypothetical protein